MNKFISIILNGLVLGITLLLLSLVKRLSWPLCVMMVPAAMWANRVQFKECFQLPSAFGSGALKLVVRGLLAFMVIYLVRQFIENLYLHRTEEGIGVAVDVLLKNTVLIFTLIIICWRSRTVDQHGAMVAIVLGMAFCAGLNLLADRFDLIAIQDSVFGESRFIGLQDRWMPPVARSNASFSMQCTVLTFTALAVMVRSYRIMLRHPLWIANILAAAAVMLWAAVKCQFRAHLVVPMVAFLWLVSLGDKLRVMLSYSLLAAFFVFPGIFFDDTGYSLLEQVTPENILSLIGSNMDGADTLSNRTLLYEFGWHKLGGSAAIWGEGPVLRDAKAAIEQTFANESYRVPYHSGLLDIWVQHGLPIGVLVTAGLVFVVTKLASFWRLAKQPEIRARSEVALISVTLWFSISILDGGIGSYFDNFCLAVFPALAGFIPHLSKKAVPQAGPTGARVGRQDVGAL